MLRAHNPLSHLRLAALILLLASVITTAAGQGCGGDDGALSAGSLGLVPNGSYGVTVVNVEQILRETRPNSLKATYERIRKKS